MSITSRDNVTVKLNNVVAIFPKLLKGQEEAFKGKGDPYFSASFRITKGDENYKAVMAAVQKAGESLWKDKAPSMLKSCAAKDKLPLHDGDLKADKAYGSSFKGYWYVSARNNASKNPAPVVVDNVIDPATGQLRVITQQNDPHAPYSGAIVNVYLSVFAYNKDGEGVAASIVGVQFVKDGQRLSGVATLAPDTFQAIPEAEEAAKSTDGASFDPFA